MDIVAEGYDAGVRLIEAVERNMVQVRLTDPFRFVVVAAPSYLERHGTPDRPEDLLDRLPHRPAGRLSCGGRARARRPPILAHLVPPVSSPVAHPARETPSKMGDSPFATSTIETLMRLSSAGSTGNRWFKVNLHVHGQGADPAKLVAAARAASVDLLAITDHQSFEWHDGVRAAAESEGRRLTVLPGMEITVSEGAHVIAVFPATFDRDRQARFYGWLEIPGTGDTKQAARKPLLEVVAHVAELGGIIVVPHPFTEKIGMLDSARKLSTKADWLESQHVHLMQVAEDKVRFIGHDNDGRWVNRYVLSSARPKDVASSRYFLAPFNRSDVDKPEDVGKECSWFRMASASVDGLKQVACEPRTRISRTEPSPVQHNHLLGLRVTGGYCDGQLFPFNERLSTLIGPNHAGKSAVLDFVRFAAGLEDSVDVRWRNRLLQRLVGILGEDSTVELFFVCDRARWVARRRFVPRIDGGCVCTGCAERPAFLRLDEEKDELVPEECPLVLDVYEQGRVSRLRDDLGNQLEMIDEFAECRPLKDGREGVISALGESTDRLAPLYEEREALKTEVAGQIALQEELTAKAKHIPDEAEQRRWAEAVRVAGELERVMSVLSDAAARLGDRDREAAGELERVFSQSLPELEAGTAAEEAVLGEWQRATETAVAGVAEARQKLVDAGTALATAAAPNRASWEAAKARHDRELAAEMRTAGVESPSELLARVDYLRGRIREIETVKKPRLRAVLEMIEREEEQRDRLRRRLSELDQQISERRAVKAKELTEALENLVRVELAQKKDVREFEQVLEGLAARVTTGERRIHSRAEQIGRIATAVAPLQLSEALRNGGRVQVGEALVPLATHCNVTDNTVKVLQVIAEDIRLLDELERTPVSDVPVVMVRRQGEEEHAELEKLSQGEQSAALLSLALHTRTTPLIIDQPEDELGYNFVVNLIVPKILEAKQGRQVIVVTHNANIPVLGDADYVIRMENRPRPPAGRACVAAAAGCFEHPGVTEALLELEGGPNAFRFREQRYRLSPPAKAAG